MVPAYHARSKTSSSRRPARSGRRGESDGLIGNSLQPRPYGILVNLIDIDFSKLLGAYVGVFALVSVLSGPLVFRDQVPASTWAGLAVILGGSLMIHFGRVGG